jgi:hypothetical protein
MVFLNPMGPHTDESTARMTNVTLHVRLETEQRLREKASRRGQTLEAYLEQLAEREAEAGAPPAEYGGQLTDSEFDRLLDELSGGPRLPHLPADFSRADIYSDHD